MNFINYLKEEQNSQQISLFNDLDGCYVDYENGYRQEILINFPELLGKYGITAQEFQNVSTREYEIKYLYNYYLTKFSGNTKKARSAAKGAYWKPIQGNINWWVNLEWMPDGKELFEYGLQLKKDNKIQFLNILSSPSSDPVCEKGKRMWLDKHGITKYFDNIIIETDKSKYAEGNPNNILIDDTIKKIDGWVQAGGTGILHKETRQTIDQLKKLGL